MLEDNENITDLTKLIKSGTPKQYILFFKQFKADIAESLANLTQKDRIQFFNKVNLQLAAEILEE